MGGPRGSHGIRRVRAARLRLLGVQRALGGALDRAPAEPRRRLRLRPRRRLERRGRHGFRAPGARRGRAQGLEGRARRVSYLRHAQNPDGGFGQSKGASSNAQSTAWAVQGLVAVGRRPEALARNGHNPISYIESLQTANGSVRYSRTSVQTPVWVTAEALVAFARKSLPLPPAKLKSHAHVAAAAPAPVKKKPVAKKKVAHARTKLHGGPIATIAQTTPAPTPAPVTPAAKVANPVKERGGDQGNGALVWALVGIGVAALVAGAYLARRWMRRQGPSPA